MHATMLLATAAFTIAAVATPERTNAQGGSPARFAIATVSNDDANGVRYFQVTSAADLDGDGRADVGVLKLTCADEQVQSARYHEWRWNNAAALKAAATPPEFARNWGAASPEMRAMKVGYDLKTSTKARTAAPGEWRDVTLSGAAGLCGNAARAVNLNSSRSN